MSWDDGFTPYHRPKAKKITELIVVENKVEAVKVVPKYSVHAAPFSRTDPEEAYLELYQPVFKTNEEKTWLYFGIIHGKYDKKSGTYEVQMVHTGANVDDDGHIVFKPNFKQRDEEWIEHWHYRDLRVISYLEDELVVLDSIIPTLWGAVRDELASATSTPPPPSEGIFSFLAEERTSDEIALLAECVAGPATRVVCRRFNIPLTVATFQRLDPGIWLNDELINATLSLYTDKHNIWVFNTYFYDKLTHPVYNYANVQRWTKSVDLFAFRGVLIPIHVSGVHWTLAVADMKTETLHYFDSMGGRDGSLILRHLLTYLQKEHQAKKLDALSSAWTMRVWTKKEIPQQSNDFDCGVFVCTFARIMVDAWVRDIAPNFTQFSYHDMPKIREQLKLELLQE